MYLAQCLLLTLSFPSILLMMVMTIWNKFHIKCICVYLLFCSPLHSKVNLDNLDESLKGQLIEGLLKLSDIVAERSKPTLGETSKVYDIESYIEVSLNTLIFCNV